MILYFDRLFFPAHVPHPVGAAPPHVRPTAGLGQMAGLLAAGHPHCRPGHQLGIGPRVDWGGGWPG